MQDRYTGQGTRRCLYIALLFQVDLRKLFIFVFSISPPSDRIGEKFPGDAEIDSCEEAKCASFR
jgi:hypothetical protein